VFNSKNKRLLFKRHTNLNKNDSFYSNKSIDWLSLGYVTPAKVSQGKCGSCTAYAIVGAIEAQYFVKTRELKNFSEQFLIDCNLLTPNICKEGATISERKLFILF